MKIRLGFVSNSSSTSFLVVIKKLPPCNACGRSDISFLDLIETIGGWRDDHESTNLHRRGAKEISAKMREDEFRWITDEEKNRWEDRFKRLEEAESKGYEVGEIEISYHDDSTNKILQDLKERRVVQILWDDHSGDHIIHI